MTGPAAARLPDGRLHFQHGPIDLVIEAFGSEPERAAALRQAWAAFQPIVDDLVAVLQMLRTPVADLAGALARSGQAGTSLPGAPVKARGSQHCAAGPLPRREGEVERGGACPAARRSFIALALAVPPDLPPIAAAMIRAAARHAPAFVTPMAAVAGAVADHVLAAMVEGRRLDRAYVNNGGDAALWLSPGTELTAAGGPGLTARIRVPHASPVRGIATSGWRGRSHSLGIADAVTVLARNAAAADAAATLIANAVDLAGHPAITRRPACELAPDSDLGDRPVTVAVGSLSAEEAAQALAAGIAAAEWMHARGMIEGAALWLAGQGVTVGARGD